MSISQIAAIFLVVILTAVLVPQAIFVQSALAVKEASELAAAAAEAEAQGATFNQDEPLVPVIENTGESQPIGKVSVTSLPSVGEDTAASAKVEVIPFGEVKQSELFNDGKSASASAASAPVHTGELMASESDLASPPAQFPNLYGGYDGIAQCDYGGCFIPPDVAMGVGPSHVLEMAHMGGEVSTKGGTLVQSFTLDSFFGAGGRFITDPKVFYDSISGRWFASIAIGSSYNRVAIAVSSTSDPSGSWCVYHVGGGNGMTWGGFPDQPILSTSNDKVIVTTNVFNPGFVGWQYAILGKSAMMSCLTTPTNANAPTNTDFSVHPAYPLSSQNEIYAVANRAWAGSQVRLFVFSGAPGSAGIARTQDLGVGGFTGIPGGQQPGTASLVAIGDARIQDAVYKDNKLWTSSSDGCVPGGDSTVRSCLRLTQITPTVCVLFICFSTVDQDFNYGIGGLYMFYPAISLDLQNDLGLVFGYSSTGTYPSLAVGGRLGVDPVNTMGPAYQVKAGVSSNTSGRYGDYHAAALDPTAMGFLWIAGEYMRPAGVWGTWINLILVDPGLMQHSLSMTLNSIPSVPWGKTIIASGKVTDASAYGLPVKGLFVTFSGTGAGGLPAATTNDDGTFSSSGLSPATVGSLTVQANTGGSLWFTPASSNIVSYSNFVHTTSLGMTNAATFRWGMPTSFTATLTDSTNGGTPISGRTIHFDGTGVIGVADKVTDGAGKAIGTGTAPGTVASGWTAQAHFAGDSLYSPSNSAVNTFKTLKHLVSLTLTLTPSTVPSNGAYTLTGIMRDATFNVPLGSKPVTFLEEVPLPNIPGVITKADGSYSRPDIADVAPGMYDITARFSGDALYSAKSSLVRVLTVT